MSIFDRNVSPERLARFSAYVADWEKRHPFASAKSAIDMWRRADDAIKRGYHPDLPIPCGPSQLSARDLPRVGE